MIDILYLEIIILFKFVPILYQLYLVFIFDILFLSLYIYIYININININIYMIDTLLRDNNIIQVYTNIVPTIFSIYI